jgi:P-type Cu+ transporter
MKKYTLVISGMHCASCAGNIERSVKSVTGVNSVQVRMLTNKAIIEAEDRVSVDELKGAVAKAGYKVVKVD